MEQKAYTMSAGVATLSVLTGMALVVQAAGGRNPPAYPITGIFFFVIGLTLLMGLVGLVWDAFNGDARAAGLLWFVVGSTGGCSVLTFYSVGLFFLVGAINWGMVTLMADRRQGRSVRRGVLLAFVAAALVVSILSFVRNVSQG